MLVALLFFCFDKAFAPEVEKETIILDQSSSDPSNDVVSSVPTEKTDFAFAIGGDMMFGRSINYYFQGDRLLDVMAEFDKSVFVTKDLSMVNLEGPISSTPFPPDNTPNNLIFNFPTKTVGVLTSLGINAVSLANNHTNNQGKVGVASTLKLLNNANIVPIGMENTFGDSSIAHFAKNETKVAVITINILETSTNLESVIAKEKGDGFFVIVFPHWGVEYSATHSLSQEKLAHHWVDAGADLVVGSHPHVLQDSEVYKGRPIFYSIGNLLFDQTFSDATQRGIVLTGKISDNDLKITIYPTASKKLKPFLLEGTGREQVLKTYFDEFGQSLNLGKGYLEFSLQY